VSPIIESWCVLFPDMGGVLSFCVVFLFFFLFFVVGGGVGGGGGVCAEKEVRSGVEYVFMAVLEELLIWKCSFLY